MNLSRTSTPQKPSRPQLRQRDVVGNVKECVDVITGKKSDEHAPKFEDTILYQIFKKMGKITKSSD